MSDNYVYLRKELRILGKPRLLNKDVKDLVVKCEIVALMIRQGGI